MWRPGGFATQTSCLQRSLRRLSLWLCLLLCLRLALPGGQLEDAMVLLVLQAFFHLRTSAPALCSMETSRFSWPLGPCGACGIPLAPSTPAICQIAGWRWVGNLKLAPFLAPSGCFGASPGLQLSSSIHPCLPHSLAVLPLQPQQP